MSVWVDPFHTLRSIPQGRYYSLPALQEQGFPNIRRLPISIRLILESLLRNCDGNRVKESDVVNLVNWQACAPDKGDVPFIVSRVILQDFTGVPLLVDLAAMRDAVAKMGKDPRRVEPQVPVDLVVDHSVQVDKARTTDAFAFNMQAEFQRNSERYAFLKWGQQAFKTVTIVPPAIGIVHQVNLEHLATIVSQKKQNGTVLLYPDTLVGTDSHTTMINGLGIVGWGVGGIEAEAAMLGQPVSLQTPEVIGVHLTGHLREGVTATDLTLHLTEMLRREKVVGKFVEFFGEGTSNLTVADRATVSNMAPEYGATIGFFPVDEQTVQYLEMTGRTTAAVKLVRDYLIAQELFGIPSRGQIDFTRELELNLGEVIPCVSGPKRPQERIGLGQVKEHFQELVSRPIASGGYGKGEPSPLVCLHPDSHFSLLPHDSGGIYELESGKAGAAWSEEEMVTNRPWNKVLSTPGYSESMMVDAILTHGSIVIAAITSCTNTSNPSVMLAAGLLAKKAVERGLQVHPMIKTSLAPGSRVVTDYMQRAGLQKYLNALGFQLVGYGCTTCIGNSGPLDERVEEAVKEHDLITASVLSGNRNFEARIHGSVKANFLMSPPLVVAFAIAGRVNIDLTKEPLGCDFQGEPVFLRDIWPSTDEVKETLDQAIEPSMFKNRYAQVLEGNPAWTAIETTEGAQYAWISRSTYIQPPPYFENFSLQTKKRESMTDMRLLAIFGDSVTTDHISPAGAFKPESPAGHYLLSLGVREEDFNSYGSRRGNHHVMMRSTFANVRLRNRMAEGREGGYTKLMPEGQLMTIFDACQLYAARGTPLIIFAGRDYGMGSSRDWAAKGPALLGVKVVVAQSFERIHRSNLIGMGILPLQFKEHDSVERLGLQGNETFSVERTDEENEPGRKFILQIQRDGGGSQQIELLSRLDTPLEAAYYQHGGILPFVLRQIIT